MVDDGLLLAGVAAGFAEFFGGVGCRVGFVDEKHGQVRQCGGEFFGEVADFLCRIALGAIEAEREADDEGADLALGGDFHDAGDALVFADGDGLDGMGHDAEFIGGGDADAGTSQINAEGWVGAWVAVFRVGMHVYRNVRRGEGADQA